MSPRLTEAKGKYGLITITLNNPSPGQALFLFVSAMVVSIVILVVVVLLLVFNIQALLNGATDFWTVLWVVLLSLYLASAVTD